MLDLLPDIDIGGTAPNGQTAAQLIREHRPDVMLTDLRMAVMNRVEATRQSATTMG